MSISCREPWSSPVGLQVRNPAATRYAGVASGDRFELLTEMLEAGVEEGPR